jgi:hypothetical protein
MNDRNRKIQATLCRDTTGDVPADGSKIAVEILNRFRGRYRWLYTFVVVAQIAAFIGLVLTTVRFSRAVEVTTRLCLVRAERVAAVNEILNDAWLAIARGLRRLDEPTCRKVL